MLSCAFSSDGTMVVTGTQTGSVLVSYVGRSSFVTMCFYMDSCGKLMENFWVLYQATGHKYAVVYLIKLEVSWPQHA